MDAGQSKECTDRSKARAAFRNKATHSNRNHRQSITWQTSHPNTAALMPPAPCKANIKATDGQHTGNAQQRKGNTSASQKCSRDTT